MAKGVNHVPTNALDRYKGALPVESQILAVEIVASILSQAARGSIIWEGLNALI